MNNEEKKQRIGHNLRPILKKAEAADALGVSVPVLSRMEEAGLVLHEFIPGMKTPVYFRATLDRIDEIHRDWKMRNPEAYQELMM